jgi:hypothetical protein
MDPILLKLLPFDFIQPLPAGLPFKLRNIIISFYSYHKNESIPNMNFIWGDYYCLPPLSFGSSHHNDQSTRSRPQGTFPEHTTVSSRRMLSAVHKMLSVMKRLRQINVCRWKEKNLIVAFIRRGETNVFHSHKYAMIYFKRFVKS